MKIKCIHCEHIYDLDFGKCAMCNKQGGYLQEPKLKQVGNIQIHLEEVLIHKKTNNHFQIKEIQDKGMVTLIVATIIPNLLNKKSYISNVSLTEYVKK